MKPGFNLFGNEKKTLKILFWCITPLLFLAFFRLFWLVFGFIFGGLASMLFGSRFTQIISAISILIALVFTVLTCRWLYLQFKENIIGKNF